MGFIEKMRERNKTIMNARNTADNIKASSMVNNNAFDRCKDYDQKIKRYDVLISDLAKKNIKNNYYGSLIKKYSAERLELQRKFAQQDCEHILEFGKLEESADILGTEFSEYEKEILEKSAKEQNKLYVIGAVVLLIGAYIIIK